MQAEQQVRLDVIILGASGFTGKYVVRELLKFRNDPRGGTRRIGLAGRSKKKVMAALMWAGGYELLPDIPILEADVCCPQSLASLCRQTRLLVSCVGPYSRYGRPVVAACVEAGIDYLDIAGEPQFMEAVEAQFHHKAVEKGSLVVSACGYDSIPAEMGVLYTTREFVRRGWTPNSVDSYLLGASGKGRRHHGHGALVNYGTYESVILSLANAQALANLRRTVPSRLRPKIPGIPARKPRLLQWEENTKTWAMKLPVADASVVRRTQSTLAGAHQLQAAPGIAPAAARLPPTAHACAAAHYGCYLSSKSYINLVGLILMAMVWAFLAKLSWGRRWLLHYPELFSFGIFSKAGPSEEVVDNTFFSMWFVGRGYSQLPPSSSQVITATGAPNCKQPQPQQQQQAAGTGVEAQPDKVIVTRISGPEMGYITTSICLVQAALLVLDSRDSLPKGGVFTPGAVFAATDLQERLHTNGLHFEVGTLEQERAIFPDDLKLLNTVNKKHDDFNQRS